MVKHDHVSWYSYEKYYLKNDKKWSCIADLKEKSSSIK